MFEGRKSVKLTVPVVGWRYWLDLGLGLVPGTSDQVLEWLVWGNRDLGWGIDWICQSNLFKGISNGFFGIEKNGVAREGGQESPALVQGWGSQGLCSRSRLGDTAGRSEGIRGEKDTAKTDKFLIQSPMGQSWMGPSSAQVRLSQVRLSQVGLSQALLSPHVFLLAPGLCLPLLSRIPLGAGLRCLFSGITVGSLGSAP